LITEQGQYSFQLDTSFRGVLSNNVLYPYFVFSFFFSFFIFHFSFFILISFFLSFLFFSSLLACIYVGSALVLTSGKATPTSSIYLLAGNHSFVFAFQGTCLFSFPCCLHLHLFLSLSSLCLLLSSLIASLLVTQTLNGFPLLMATPSSKLLPVAASQLMYPQLPVYP
jgi:hypothetical protein